MYLRFAFEDGAETLEYMAQSMRRKLDLVGVKIGLKGWQAMTRAERLALAHFPVDMDDERAAFVQVLRGFAERAGAKVGTVAAVDAVDARAWGKERVPDAVRAHRAAPQEIGGALHRQVGLHADGRVGHELGHPEALPGLAGAPLGEVARRRGPTTERPSITTR
jgi:hypothetical protein